MENLRKILKECLKRSKIKLLTLFLEEINNTCLKPNSQMNNLLPKDTGLDTEIWLMPQSDENNLKHSKNRIKVVDQNHPKGNNAFPLVFNKGIDDLNYLDKLKLSKRSKYKLKIWINKNKDLLKKYANNEISFQDFLKLMQKVK